MVGRAAILAGVIALGAANARAEWFARGYAAPPCAAPVWVHPPYAPVHWVPPPVSFSTWWDPDHRAIRYNRYFRRHREAPRIQGFTLR
jgi:hypothetical protein